MNHEYGGTGAGTVQAWGSHCCGRLGIGETETLNKLLSVMGTDVDVTVKQTDDKRCVSIVFSDDDAKSEYF